MDRKMKTNTAILASIFALSAVNPALAREYQPGYSHERTCFKSEYREEYVPGTEDSPGYVKSWKDTVEVPCEDTPTEFRQSGKGYGSDGRKRRPYRRHVTVYEDIDDNSCVEGTLIGGLLGGGLAGFGSRGKDQWWAIPLGAVGGSMIGCQIDGG